MSKDTDNEKRMAELEADNRRLRELLDMQDAPGELRHRLRNTLSILRMMIRRSAETRRDIDSYVAHIEDRVDVLMRIQAMIDSAGTIDLHTVLTDELLNYGALEGEQAVLSGPAIALQPKAGQALAMAIHELAVNAVEHGELGNGEGRVEVTWSISGSAPERRLTFDWRELAKPESSEPYREGFGTKVITQMLRYELEAETAIAFEGGKFQCSISMPLSERIGQLADS